MHKYLYMYNYAILTMVMMISNSIRSSLSAHISGGLVGPITGTTAVWLFMARERRGVASLHGLGVVWNC